jgi:hypothetical protein
LDTVAVDAALLLTGEVVAKPSPKSPSSDVALGPDPVGPLVAELPDPLDGVVVDVLDVFDVFVVAGGEVVVVVVGGGGVGTFQVNPLGSLELATKVIWMFHRVVTWPWSAPCSFTQARPVSQTPGVVPSLRSSLSVSKLPLTNGSHSKSPGSDGSAPVVLFVDWKP